MNTSFAIVLVLILLAIYYFSTQGPAVSPCAAYGPTSVGVSNECLRRQWADSGCLTGETLIPDTYNGWWSQQPYSLVTSDMKLWATERDDSHRNGCYGTDRTKWPA